MRKVAGIILIIFGVTTIGLFIFDLIGPSYYDYDHSYFTFIINIGSAVLFVTGGVFCLKRKYWALCFTSSLFLHIFMTASFIFVFFFFSTLLWVSLIPVWILPLIFICLRKREWQAQEFQG
jgi:hypothetical protein